MVEGREHKTSEETQETRLSIYGTNRSDPDAGRVFVWTPNAWFERIEGSQGNVAFTPIADSEAELRELIERDNPEVDFIELGGEYRKMVSDEFIEQAIDYRDTPAYSDEEAVDEDENQEYHQHDL